MSTFRASSSTVAAASGGPVRSSAASTANAWLSSCRARPRPLRLTARRGVGPGERGPAVGEDVDRRGPQVAVGEAAVVNRVERGGHVVQGAQDRRGRQRGDRDQVGEADVREVAGHQRGRRRDRVQLPRSGQPGCRRGVDEAQLAPESTQRVAAVGGDHEMGHSGHAFERALPVRTTVGADAKSMSVRLTSSLPVFIGPNSSDRITAGTASRCVSACADDATRG